MKNEWFKYFGVGFRGILLSIPAGLISMLTRSIVLVRNLNGDNWTFLTILILTFGLFSSLVLQGFMFSRYSKFLLGRG